MKKKKDIDLKHIKYKFFKQLIMSECEGGTGKAHGVYPDETISFSWNAAKMFDTYHIVMHFPYQ